MERQSAGLSGFDPDFDDTEWTDEWLHVPIAQVPPGRHESGYRVERHALQRVTVFGKSYQLAAPLWCRLLFDASGNLWMSDTPQERIMMFNNGRKSQGHVLVGGLGLGLYPQCAESVGQATRFTVIEHSPVIREIVEPTLSMALGVPIEIRIGDVAAFLSLPAQVLYDTIFLDTWDTIDPVHLPAVNRLRNMALSHLAPGGRVLLWGYRWMVRLFEDACRRLLLLMHDRRRNWLVEQAATTPGAAELLEPVLEHFQDRQVADLEEALAWCRQYIVYRDAPL